MKENQPSQGADRIRAAVERNPRKMTLQLARDLGVPEVEVIRAFPSDRVMELDIARWEELLRSLEPLGAVRVLVSNGATTIEVDEAVIANAHATIEPAGLACQEHAPKRTQARRNQDRRDRFAGIGDHGLPIDADMKRLPALDSHSDAQIGGIHKVNNEVIR